MTSTATNEETVHRTYSLDYWIRKFHQIYGSVNKHRHPGQIWAQVIDNASQLAEMIRRPPLNTDEALKFSMNIFLWTIAFVGKYTIPNVSVLEKREREIGDPIGPLLRQTDESDPDDFLENYPESYSKWLLLKYPTVCPKCAKNPCVCPSYRRIIEGRHDLYKREYEEFESGLGSLKEEAKSKALDIADNFITNNSLEDTIHFFIDIYGGANFDLDIWKINAHLLEEIGEVTSELLTISELNIRTENGVNINRILKHLDKKGKFEDGKLPDLKDLIGRNEREIICSIRGKIAKNIKEELADVFSWLSALLNKIGDELRAREKDPKKRKEKKFLADYIKPKFEHKIHAGHYLCPYCDNAVCSNKCFLLTTIPRLYE